MPVGDLSAFNISRHGWFTVYYISCCDEDILSHQQQYPVIFISLKSGKQANYRLTYTELKKRISDVLSRHKYVLQSEILSEKELSQYKDIMNLTDDETLYLDSIGFLSQCLAKYHGRNTFILIRYGSCFGYAICFYRAVFFIAFDVGSRKLSIKRFY